MPEPVAASNVKASRKRGLHGWKAFLVVFASGSAAAFLIFGLIVGGLRLFVSSVSSGIQQGSQDDALVEQTGRPQETIPPGKLNICDRTLPTTDGVQLQRVDDGSNFRDDAESGGNSSDRIVSDECDWDLVPAYTSIEPWEFKFSYHVFLESEDMESRDEKASALYEEWKGQASDRFEEVLGEGAANYGDESYFMHGDPEGEGESGYSALVIKRSAVYLIDLAAKPSSDGNRVPEGAFRHEVDNMTSRLDKAFHIRIPE